MMKSTIAFLLVLSIFTVSTTLPVTAQQQLPSKEAPAAKDSSSADMKEIFAKQTKEVKADAAEFDPVKTERERGNRQAQTKGWSKTKKVLVYTAIAVGIAAVTFLVIKYYRKCLRYSDNCYYDSNTGTENCPCEEYEPRND